MKFNKLIEALENKVNPPSARRDREERINTKPRALKLAHMSDDDIDDNGLPRKHYSDGTAKDGDFNFEEKVKSSPSNPINKNAIAGDKSIPRAVQESRIASLNRIMGKPSSLSSFERNLKDKINHQFSDSIGGNSSNYNGNKFSPTRPDVKRDIKNMKEDYHDLETAYINDIEDYINDIIDVVENEDFSSSDMLPMIALRLREARDTALTGIQHNSEDDTASHVNESWKSGNMALSDGSSIFVNQIDAHYLNNLFSKAINRDSLDKLARKNSKEYTSILQFAKSLDEEEILENISEDELVEFFIENYDFDDISYIADLFEEIESLSEAKEPINSLEDAKDHLDRAEEIIKNIIKWMRRGMHFGAGVGAITGGVAGAAAGGVSGAAWEGTKAAGRAVVRSSTRKKIAKAANKIVKEETDFLDETSKEKTEKYLDKAISDHGMSNFARNSTKGEEKKHWERKTKNRKSGISRAIDKLNKNTDCGCDDEKESERQERIKKSETNTKDWYYESQPGKKKKAFNLGKYLENNKKRTSK